MTRNWFAVHAHNRRGGSHAHKKRVTSKRSCRGQVWVYDEDDYWDDKEESWGEEEEESDEEDTDNDWQRRDGSLEESRRIIRRCSAVAAPCKRSIRWHCGWRSKGIKR